MNIFEQDFNIIVDYVKYLENKPKSNYVSKDLVKQLHLDPAYLSRLLIEKGTTLELWELKLN